MISNNIKAEMKRAWAQVLKSERIFLTTHQGTDGDDLGSLLAMQSALSKLNKKFLAAVDKGVPNTLKFLPGALEVDHKFPESDFDLVITFGCGQLSRTGFSALDKFSGPIINIDHHPDNKLFGTINIVEPATSSVAELMYYFFNTNELYLDKNAATCLLTGIFTDTGGFKHSNTSPEALIAASELMKRGARIDKIARMILGQKNPQSLKIWARALENTRFNPWKKLIFSVLTDEDFVQTKTDDNDLDGFVSFLNSMPKANYSLLLRQDGEVVRGSLRSEPERGVDVNKIAARFGGGGHKLASGFKIKGKLIKTENGWKIV